MHIPKPASKKEYGEYASRLSRVRAAELEKPEHERDEALIKECGESILYCMEQMKTAPKDSKAGLRSKTVRRIIAAAAIVAVLLVSNVISFASGRALLFDSLYWNVKRFRLYGSEDYGPDYENGVAIPRENTVRCFESEEELRAFFGEELLLPGHLKGVYFVSATSEGEKGNAAIHCEYRVNKKKLILEIDTYDRGLDDILTELDLDSLEKYSMFYRWGVLIGESANYTFVSFEKRDGCYLLVGSQGTEILEDIARNMLLRSGK